MSVTDRARHELHERLVELMGRDHAETLMESLAPTGWGDVVTRDYLDLRLSALEHRLISVAESKARGQTTLLVGLLLSQTAILLTFLIALR